MDGLENFGFCVIKSKVGHGTAIGHLFCCRLPRYSMIARISTIMFMTVILKHKLKYRKVTRLSLPQVQKVMLKL